MVLHKLFVPMAGLFGFPCFVLILLNMTQHWSTSALGRQPHHRLRQTFFPDEEQLRLHAIRANKILTNVQPLPRKMATASSEKAQVCSLPRSLVDEIASYQNVTNRIIHEILHGTFRGRTYEDLSLFLDKFGSRLEGTENLENSIDFLLKKMKEDGLDNVHGEEVIVPHWVRGAESAELILPRTQKLAMLGLGSSVGTPPGGIQAEVLVVKDFRELKNRAKEAAGKIVVFNEDYNSYSLALKYQRSGAAEVAKVGFGHRL